MSGTKLILKEIAYRKWQFALSLLAVAVAVALWAAFEMTGEASQRETDRIVRDMGFNLRIIPRGTDMVRFWSAGYSDQTMPEDYVQRFLRHKGFAFTHLVATLQQKVAWRGMEVILTGIMPEVRPPDFESQKPMSLTAEEKTFSIKPGTIFVGHEIAHKLGIREGEMVDLLGKDLEVIRCLSESGGGDDVRIYGHLHDIQEVLKQPGRINEIKALQCMCLFLGEDPKADPRDLISKQLGQVLPDAKAALIQPIYQARMEQRDMQEKLMAILLPLVLVVCGVWVGVLAMLNVRDRREEIGLMRAVGYGSGAVAGVFLARAVAIGLIGAVAGFYAGTFLALRYGPGIFKFTAGGIQAGYRALWLALAAAPLFAALCSFIPTAIAVVQDPAVTLRQE